MVLWKMLEFQTYVRKNPFIFCFLLVFIEFSSICQCLKSWDVVASVASMQSVCLMFSL